MGSLLQRCMTLDDFDPTDMWQFGDDADEELVAVMDKHLPEGWKHNPKHRRQVYHVVENYLKTPAELSTKEREKRAREKTLAQEPVNAERTIADAVGRRLYSSTPYRETFRGDVERIERDYRTG